MPIACHVNTVMADRSKEECTRLTPTNHSERNSDEDTNLDALTRLRMVRLRIKEAKKAAPQKTSQPAAESNRTKPTTTIQNENESELPSTKHTAPSSTLTVQRWVQQAGKMVLALSSRALSAIRLSAGKGNEVPAVKASVRSTPDSRSDWDVIDARAEVGHGQYDQFVEQQDAREYDQLDERETESGDDVEEDVRDLGGEAWDKTL